MRSWVGTWTGKKHFIFIMSQIFIEIGSFYNARTHEESLKQFIDIYQSVQIVTQDVKKIDKVENPKLLVLTKTRHPRNCEKAL